MPWMCGGTAVFLLLIFLCMPPREDRKLFDIHVKSNLNGTGRISVDGILTDSPPGWNRGAGEAPRYL